MKNTRDLFRENLREIITRRGLTLEPAAELCEISLSTLNQILSGATAYSPETIDKICKGLNLSQNDLFSDSTTHPTLPTHPLSKSDLILDIQARLTALNYDELTEVLGFIDSLGDRLATTSITKKTSSDL